MHDSLLINIGPLPGPKAAEPIAMDPVVCSEKMEGNGGNGGRV